MIGVIIIDLLVAALAGWIAGKIMNHNKSLLRNIIVGLVGGIVGICVFGIFSLHTSGILGSIIVAVIGACIVEWLVSIIFK